MNSNELTHGDLQEYNQKQADAHDTVDLKKGLVHSAEVVWLNQPMFISQEHGHATYADEIDHTQLRRGGPVQGQKQPDHHHMAHERYSQAGTYPEACRDAKQSCFPVEIGVLASVENVEAGYPEKQSQ